MKSYASLADLKLRLGIPTATTTYDDALALALVAGTRWVDWRVGDLDVVADDAWTGTAAGVSVATTPPSRLVMATLAAAVRFYKGAEVPFGVAGMNDDGMVAYVKSSIPEASFCWRARSSPGGSPDGRP